jgi:hypothetical protein
MKHSANYLHRRISPDNQSAQDRAFMRTLIALIIVCVIAILAGKAHGQQSSSAKPVPTEAPTAKPSPAPAPASSKPAKPAKPEFTPTVEQSKDLRIAQLEAINAQQSWNAAAMKLPEYGAFNQAVNMLGLLCQKIKAENKWPGDVGCDINSNPVTFGRQTEQPPVSGSVSGQPAAVQVPKK